MAGSTRAPLVIARFCKSLEALRQPRFLPTYILACDALRMNEFPKGLPGLELCSSVLTTYAVSWKPAPAAMALKLISGGRMMGVIILIFRVLLMHIMGTAVGRCPASFGRRHTVTVWGQSGFYHVLALVMEPGAAFRVSEDVEAASACYIFHVLC
jgi:hypothetical protein